jgi:ABC-type glycerol-3-phosphate transport system substrate-binding protein
MKLHVATVSAALALTFSASASAQVTEVPFYFPVAVGGPITKFIDQFATEFNKENPTIKVAPIYAGSYQDTIVKALTAHKAGTPPVASVLLSTDTFTARSAAKRGACRFSVQQLCCTGTKSYSKKRASIQTRHRRRGPK